VSVCTSLFARGRTPSTTAAQAALSIFNGPMVIIKNRASERETGFQNEERKECHRMNRAWAEVLVALLVAATETLIEVVKRIKKKGQVPS
jgi:hypothetical protein